MEGNVILAWAFMLASRGTQHRAPQASKSPGLMATRAAQGGAEPALRSPGENFMS